MFPRNNFRFSMVPIAMLVLALFVSDCAKAIDPNDLPRIELTAENIVSKEVWLRVKFVNAREPWEFVVERNGQQIAAGRTQKADTLVIDTTASPRSAYKYKAIQVEGTSRTMESDVVQVQTLDTTSHAVQWQVDTLGVRGTIFDVWHFSRDNIWAAGEIFIKDSTGKEDPVLYNLAKWNGQQWTVIRVMFSICNNQGTEVGFSPAIIRSIYAFGQNDVWLGGGGNFVHWNGTTFSRACLPAGIIQGELLKLWGTTSNNLICVGRNGTVIRYNGNVWQKMESGTTVDLEDVWGIDEKHVWATGTNIDDGSSVILQSDGRNWRVIYDSNDRPLGSDYRFSTLWGISSNVLVLTGRSFITYLHLNDFSIRQQISSAKWFIYRIRGSGANDLFTAGQASELQHYNGASWHLYLEVKRLNGGSAFWYTVYVHEKLVVVGGYFFIGLYGVPVVLRGSR